jgi:hypothetical protein
VDPISVTELAAVIAQAAAGEAGKGAWDGLLGLVRRAFKRDRLTMTNRTMSGDESATVELAGDLVQQCTADPEFAAALRQWVMETGDAIGDGQVTNVIRGHARIHGNVVQAHDVGDIRF